MVCFGLLLFFVGSLAATSPSGCSGPFVPIKEQWCIFVNVTGPPNRRRIGAPLTWHEARESCQNYIAADLVDLHDPKKLEAISKYIDQNYSIPTELDHNLWVGAQGKGNDWQWDRSGASINLWSNIWLPNQPSGANETTILYGKLVRVGSTHGRLYLASDTSRAYVLAYICEQPWRH